MFAPLADLTAALRRLDTALDALDDDALADVLAGLGSIRVQCDSVWLRAVGAAEQRSLHRHHGVRDMATWLAGLAGERRGTARRDVDLAHELETAPPVAEAMAHGTVSKAKAAELVRARHLPDEVQEQLVDAAAALPVEEVARAVERARLAHGTPPPVVTPELHITRQAGHAEVRATLDLVDAETLDVALAVAVEAADLPKDLPYPQRRAHALGVLARYYLEHQATVTGRVGRPHVMVLVDLEVLEARTGGSAMLGSGAVITGDAARRLAEDANITRIITKGRSEVLDVGRATRTVPTGMAKAVIARDRHCRYAGCHAPPDMCEVHHRRPWAKGGLTALWNLGLLCWFHHHFVHERGAGLLRETDDGRWTVAPEPGLARVEVAA